MNTDCQFQNSVRSFVRPALNGCFVREFFTAKSQAATTGRTKYIPDVKGWTEHIGGKDYKYISFGSYTDSCDEFDYCVVFVDDQFKFVVDCSKPMNNITLLFIDSILKIFCPNAKCPFSLGKTSGTGKNGFRDLKGNYYAPGDDYIETSWYTVQQW